VTGGDRRTQTRRKRIFCHQTGGPFVIPNVAEPSDIRLTTQPYAYVQAEALRRAAGVLDRVSLVGEGTRTTHCQTTAS